MNRQRLCSNCGSPCDYRCSRCKDVWYCSGACQLAMWPLHKETCRPIQPATTPPATTPPATIDCPICFDATDAAVTTLSCAHTLHTTCLDKWIQASKDEHRQATCPMCRTRIEVRELEWTFPRVVQAVGRVSRLEGHHGLPLTFASHIASNFEISQRFGDTDMRHTMPLVALSYQAVNLTVNFESRTNDVGDHFPSGSVNYSRID